MKEYTFENTFLDVGCTCSPQFSGLKLAVLNGAEAS